MIPNFNSSINSQMYTLQLHQQGLSIQEIAHRRNVSESVVSGHLIKLIGTSQSVDINRLVSLPRQQAITEAIGAVGDTRLQIIYEYLGEQYSYDEICLVRAALRQYRMEF
ncbi:ATP-dependent DNA helicase RecQ [Lyngbya sp. PCC 8106]|nr:ATP-dependent DNA helicase RecQ [Lyngbya sp. PCC 8106]